MVTVYTKILVRNILRVLLPKGVGGRGGEGGGSLTQALYGQPPQGTVCIGTGRP